MARSSDSQGLDCAGVAAQGRPARLLSLAGLWTRALARVDAAVASLLFWHEVSRRIEYLLTLDDSGLRRRGLDRNEIVPAVFRDARARWGRGGE